MRNHYLLLVLLSAACITAPAQLDVLTVNYGSDRTNANLNERVLTTANVNAASFGRLFSLPVDGFIYAQPLYVHGFAMPDKGTRNVVFVATMHNSVYAFDADSPQEPLWKVDLGPSVPSSHYNFRDILPEVGILSTPVIDRDTGTLYAVANTVDGDRYAYSLHALDIFSGAEKFGGPVEIQGSVQGSGAGGSDGVLPFNPFQHLQRPGLVLANGAVYVAFGSHADQMPYHGWIFAYNAANLTEQVARFAVAPDGSAGSIWQSGRGMAADEDGNIYAVTANGDFNGLTNWGESVLKLGTAGGLAVLDWFTPDIWKDLNDRDDDFGSCGPVLIPGTRLLVTGSKRGIVYLLDRGNMGLLSAGDSAILQSFQAVTFGIFSNFVLWSKSGGPILYARGISDTVKAYRMTGGRFETQPFSRSSVYGGLPYDGMALSANGGASGTGILWLTMMEYEAHPAPGVVRAFDAEDLKKELWNSAKNPARDRLGYFAKFATPTVANGKVYVPTFSGELAVYGLLGAAPRVTGVANAASLREGPVSPGELISIYGAGFGPAEPARLALDTFGRVSTRLGGARVYFDGVPAPLYFAWMGQVNAVVPYSVAGHSSTKVQVEENGRVFASLELPVAASAAGLFTLTSTGAGRGAVLNQDHTINSQDNPARRGSIIVLYGTGEGQVDRAVADGAVAAAPLPRPLLDVSVTIDGKPAEILYAGAAPGLVSGVIQVNARVPEDASRGAEIPAVLAVGGASSQPGVVVAVR